MKNAERFNQLCQDEGFVKTVKGYSESNYSFESYFKGLNFRKSDVVKAIKYRIWENKENEKYFN